MENSIGDRIEEKYTRYLNCETDELDLTIEEAKHILVNDHKQRYVDDLLEESWKIVLSELEKKDKIIDLMAEFISKFDLDESICKDIKCNNDVTKQDCINCIKKYFFDTKKNIF